MQFTGPSKALWFQRLVVAGAAHLPKFRLSLQPRCRDLLGLPHWLAALHDTKEMLLKDSPDYREHFGKLKSRGEGGVKAA